MQEPRLTNTILALLEIVRDQHLRINQLEQMLQHHYDAAETHVQEQIDENVKEHAKQTLLSGPQHDEMLQRLDSIIREIRRQ